MRCVPHAVYRQTCVAEVVGVSVARNGRVSVDATRDAPRQIDIVFTGDDTMPSLGLGEPPSVPMAPAVANAIFGACGARVRALPIRLKAVVRAMSEKAAMLEA